VKNYPVTDLLILSRADDIEIDLAIRRALATGQIVLIDGFYYTKENAPDPQGPVNYGGLEWS